MLNLYRNKHKNLIFISILILTTSFLQSCADIAMTGCQAVYNRKSLSKNFGDQYITMQAHQALYITSDEFKNTNISIATFNREMLMAGQVPAAWQKVKAEKLVRKIPNIERVYNLVTIGTPSSTLTRMSDSWITGKVKAKILASSDIDSQIKVVTENGVVYLMGTLQPQEAQAAVEVAQNTDGVQGVIKMFSYISISRKLKENFSPQPREQVAQAQVDEADAEPPSAGQQVAQTQSEPEIASEPRQQIAAAQTDDADAARAPIESPSQTEELVKS